MTKTVATACAIKIFTMNLCSKNTLMQNKDEDKDEDKVLRLLKANNDKLTEINTNMLKVFWIVAIFALLYFGLMIYMLFFRI